MFFYENQVAVIKIFYLGIVKDLFVIKNTEKLKMRVMSIFAKNTNTIPHITSKFP